MVCVSKLNFIHSGACLRIYNRCCVVIHSLQLFFSFLFFFRCDGPKSNRNPPMTVMKYWSLHDISFLVADTQLYMRLCPSIGPLVRPLVGPLVHDDRVEKSENAHLWCCSYDILAVCVRMSMGWKRVWVGVLCPCQPVQNNIATPRHLLFLKLATTEIRLYTQNSLISVISGFV